MLVILIDALIIVLGSSIGMLLKKSISEKASEAIMISIGLYVLYDGIVGVSTDVNSITIMLSLIAGAVIGTVIDIDSRVNTIGKEIELKLSKYNNDNNFAKGFITMIMLSCTGAFTFIASINVGLGNYDMQYTKIVIDLFVSMMLGASLGLSVAFASIIVFLYQAILALFADSFSLLLVGEALETFSCVGAILTIPIGTNLIGISNVKVVNYVPAIVVAPLLVEFLTRIC